MGGELNSPPMLNYERKSYFFFFAAAFLAGAFFTTFLAAGFLAASFLAGAFFATFLVAIDNPPFRSAVAVDEKIFDQH
jgi:hypothetical protein